MIVTMRPGHCGFQGKTCAIASHSAEEESARRRRGGSNVQKNGTLASVGSPVVVG